MNGKRYGPMGEELEASPDLPWWWKGAWNIGPILFGAGLMFGVFFGWIPSPMLSALEKVNTSLSKFSDLQTAVSETQKAVATSQKAMAEAATARDARMEALQIKLENLAKGNRMSCRAMAKMLKNQDMNEKCDEL